MDPIAVAAGTALVGAMATDVWQAARAEVVAVWRRVRPDEADSVTGELAEVRAEMLAARQSGDPDIQQALAGAWQLRLQQLLDDDPGLADPLRRVLDEHLVPTLAPDERTRIDADIMSGRSYEPSRVYRSGRKPYSTER